MIKVNKCIDCGSNFFTKDIDEEMCEHCFSHMCEEKERLESEYYEKIDAKSAYKKYLLDLMFADIEEIIDAGEPLSYEEFIEEYNLTQ